MANKMERNKILKEIANLQEKYNIIVCLNHNSIFQKKDINRLLLLKKSIKENRLDSIEYRDILDIDMNNCKTYADLRKKNIDNYKLIKGFRKLSISIFNSENQFKGKYAYLN